MSQCRHTYMPQSASLPETELKSRKRNRTADDRFTDGVLLLFGNSVLPRFIPSSLSLQKLFTVPRSALLVHSWFCNSLAYTHARTYYERSIRAGTETIATTFERRTRSKDCPTLPEKIILRKSLSIRKRRRIKDKGKALLTSNRVIIWDVALSVSVLLPL